jgi:hypothetical protein
MSDSFILNIVPTATSYDNHLLVPANVQSFSHGVFTVLKILIVVETLSNEVAVFM